MNNMFTTSCFIRKNTPELRKKLEELGYTNGAWESPHFEYPYLECWPNRKFGLFKGEGFYMTEDDYRLDDKVWTYNPKEDVIDCEDNEELFLAVAALRDDTDYMQWFTDGEKWFQNKQNDIEVIRHGAGNPINFHKATVEEIIEHFK